MSYVAFIGLGGSGVDTPDICELGRGAEAGLVVGVDAGAARGGDFTRPFVVLGGPSARFEPMRECEGIVGLGPYEGEW